MQLNGQKCLSGLFKRFKRVSLALAFGATRPCLGVSENPPNLQFQGLKIDLCSYHCLNYFSRSAPVCIQKINEYIYIYIYYERGLWIYFPLVLALLDKFLKTSFTQANTAPFWDSLHQFCFRKQSNTLVPKIFLFNICIKNLLAFPHCLDLWLLQKVPSFFCQLFSLQWQLNRIKWVSRLH